jgi:hypothetical protein
VIEDYLPDYPYVASYVVREESTTSTEETTATTLPPTTTSTIQSPTTTTTAPDESRFSDVLSSHPYKAQIDDLATREIVGGFDDGTFRPNAPVTRQQFAKMVAKTFALPVSELDICPFGDVPTSMASPDPLYPDHYVAVCAARQITLGKSPTSFAPFANISRAQLLTMVSRAASLAEPPADYMPPFPQFDTTHYPFARRAAYAGLLDGLQGIGPTFAFTAQATRGEVCVLLHNVLHR